MRGAPAGSRLSDYGGTRIAANDLMEANNTMQSSRRGIFLMVLIIGISALVGGLYGPQLKATAAESALRRIYDALDINPAPGGVRKYTA